MEGVMDSYTQELFNILFEGTKTDVKVPDNLSDEIKKSLKEALEHPNLTQPVVDLFVNLLKAAKEYKASPEAFGIDRETLVKLARQHEEADEHHVTVGGRVLRALPIVEEANRRVEEYLKVKDEEAPSGIELWDIIQENMERIKKQLGMTDEDWNSFNGQLKFAINSVEELAKAVLLPEDAIRDVARVTKHYRMRISPYYASLIIPGKINDPVLLQSVPTGEMIDNAGIEIPPVAADHSPARLIDQFYPRVVAVKVTNMCAMYCTHCLRIAHIGKKDRIYPKETYKEALDYIRKNTRIRDVLLTGGDALMLPNHLLKWLLDELLKIDHVRVIRLGTRIPVTVPQRIDDELLDILEYVNDQKPLRVVTQINTPQEITPVSKEAFRKISKRVSAILNQAVLLKGINDSKYKMWKLCEVIHESYVRPYYVFNCSFRNPQFAHFRVPVEVGRDIIESMYGNISGDAIPRYIATAGGKVPLHRSNVMGRRDNNVVLRKPWDGSIVEYPDADPERYWCDEKFAFAKYNWEGK